jgi:hypothetical protein
MYALPLFLRISDHRFQTATVQPGLPGKKLLKISIIIFMQMVNNTAEVQTPQLYPGIISCMSGNARSISCSNNVVSQC